MLKCGHCRNWMKKSDCPKEAKGIMVNAGMLACDKYSEEPWFTELCLERKR